MNNSEHDPRTFEVLRLLKFLPDPFRVLGVDRTTNFDKVPPQLQYVEDELEARNSDSGESRDAVYSTQRIRYFRDLFLENKKVTPIEVDNNWSRWRPTGLVLVDGHHRLCGAILARSVHVDVSYSGAEDALTWLKGESTNPPNWLNS